MTTETITQSLSPVAGFWRRLLAIAVDASLLLGAGYLLGMAFKETFAEMGSWGRLVGVGIAAGYVGILNSRIGGGRSPGKRVARLRVVGEDGSPLSLWRSLARALVLTLHFLVQPMRIWQLGWLPAAVLAYILLAVWKLGIACFYLFRPRACRGLHDLVTRSCVVREGSGPVGAVSLQPPALWHYLVWGGITAMVVSVPIATELGYHHEALIGQYSTVRRLEALGEVRSAWLDLRVALQPEKAGQLQTVEILLRLRLPCSCGPAGSSNGSGARPPGVYLGASQGNPGGGYGYEPGPAAEDPREASVCPGASGESGSRCAVGVGPGCPCALRKLAARVAGIVLETYPKIDDRETFTVRIRRDYDIWIESGTVGKPYSESLLPAQWRTRGKN